VKFHFVICVALLAACKGHELKKLEGVRVEVCACKTIACAETAMGKLPTKNVESTPRSQGLAREMLDCLAHLYEIERPVTGSDVAPEASPPAGSAAP
jgi:hypothetical protein